MKRESHPESLRRQIRLQDRLAEEARSPHVGSIHANLAVLYRQQLRRLVLDERRTG